MVALSGCDLDSNTHLVAPGQIAAWFSGGTIPCPDPAFSGCMEVDFSEGNPWLDGLQLWYDEIEAPSSACTAAYTEMAKVLEGLTSLGIFTYTGDSVDPNSLGAVLYDEGPPQVNYHLGLRRGEGLGIAADGSVDDPTDIGWILGHEGFHLKGAHGIDQQSGNNTPGGMSSLCASYDPPV
jgi:hypothetical protein